LAAAEAELNYLRDRQLKKTLIEAIEKRENNTLQGKNRKTTIKNIQIPT
jgi:hypothetical protein